MRGHQQPPQVAGKPARGGRLGVQHVERGRPDPPRPQRLDDRVDVLDTEPPGAGRLPGELPGLLVTPHMAYYSEESLAESQRKAATQIIKVLTGGQPDYPVRP